MKSNSFPPKSQKFEEEFFKSKKNAQVKKSLTFFLKTNFLIKDNILRRNSKELGFEENYTISLFSQKSLEKECMQTHVSKIMVLGEKSTGKKSLIHNLFSKCHQLNDDKTSAFTKGLTYYFRFF